MKTIIKTVAFLFLSFGVNAQTEETLAEWQVNNPGKIVMTQANFDVLDTELQELIASRVVFKDQIGFGLLDFEKTLEEQPISEIEDINFVKNWLAQNQDVKIITNSEYNASSTADQLMYDQPSILVLIGDELTEQDILNF